MIADILSYSSEESLFPLSKGVPFSRVAFPKRPREKIVVYSSRPVRACATPTAFNDARIELFPHGPERIVLTESVFGAHEFLEYFLRIVQGFEIVDERSHVDVNLAAVGTEHEIRELLKEAATRIEVDFLAVPTTTVASDLPGDPRSQLDDKPLLLFALAP